MVLFDENNLHSCGSLPRVARIPQVLIPTLLCTSQPALNLQQKKQTVINTPLKSLHEHPNHDVYSGHTFFVKYSAWLLQ